jgi:hypothetical protein
MKKQNGISKDLLSLAGEHRVASELCKLGLFATITPGKRKQTDLYAINDDSKIYVRIEVKSSQTNRFVTGISQRKIKVDYNPPHFWVLVLFERGTERFFVLTNGEIESLQERKNKPFLARFREKNGKDFDLRVGVDNLSISDLNKIDHENRWDKIATEVQLTGALTKN